MVRCRFKFPSLEQWNVNGEFTRRMQRVFVSEGFMLPGEDIMPHPLGAPAGPPGPLDDASFSARQA